MKKEPLKNKTFYGHNEDCGKTSKDISDSGIKVGAGDMVWKDDVESAVEWLKKDLKNYFKLCNKQNVTIRLLEED